MRELRLAKMFLTLQVAPAALEELAKVGFDPVVGARPLKRAIQQRIENPLSKLILEGKFPPKSTINLDAKARDWLADAGYDPGYGARPLKRVIQRRLQDPLAQLLLEGRIGDGQEVKVSAGKTGLTIDGQSFDIGDDVFAPEPPSHAIH